MQGGKKGGKSRIEDRNLATFERDCPRYEGTPEEFSGHHAKRYGHEEQLNPDGSHQLKTPKFPNSTTRDDQHKQYSQSTKARDKARNGYENGHRDAERDFKRMTVHEIDYYKAHTSGLVPDQHAALERRARELQDKAYNNATKREDFLQSHPHGYHSMQEQQQHRTWARDAYVEHERAKGLQSHHEEYQSSKADARRDIYGRRVADRRFPYE